MATNAKYAPLDKFIAHIKNRGLPTASHYYVNIFGGSVDQNVFMMCDSTELPGRSLMTDPLRIAGETTEMPYAPVYNEINLSFINDNDFAARKYFDDWMNEVYDFNKRNFGYYENYVRTVEITVTDKDGGARYTVKLQEAYPKTIGQSNLDYSNHDVIKIPVTLVYKWWEHSLETKSGEPVDRSQDPKTPNVPKVSNRTDDINGLDITDQQFNALTGSRPTYINSTDPLGSAFGAATGAVAGIDSNLSNMLNQNIFPSTASDWRENVKLTDGQGNDVSTNLFNISGGLASSLIATAPTSADFNLSLSKISDLIVARSIPSFRELSTAAPDAYKQMFLNVGRSTNLVGIGVTKLKEDLYSSPRPDTMLNSARYFAHTANELTQSYSMIENIVTQDVYDANFRQAVSGFNKAASVLNVSEDEQSMARNLNAFGNSIAAAGAGLSNIGSIIPELRPIADKLNYSSAISVAVGKSLQSISRGINDFF